jgi:predicted GNAT superfamily acetyltransferase
VQSEAEYHAVEEIQRVAWEFNDLDIVPAATLMAIQHAGGMVLGAFEGDKMMGFACGFPAFEEGRASIHSHMLAVVPEYRNLRIGFKLKLAQREFALARGLDEITWTYDPLQSLNAHLNFGKLGVISRRYIVNFYGEETSSPLHQGLGTDRLWVNWLLASDRVKERIAGCKQAERPAVPALVYSEKGRPKLASLNYLLSHDSCLIEIPHDITALKQREPNLCVEWRETTRAAFLAAVDAGFTARDFLREGGGPSPRWFYLLSR